MKRANNNDVEHGAHGDADTLSSTTKQRNAKNLQHRERQQARQRCKHVKATRAQQ